MEGVDEKKLELDQLLHQQERLDDHIAVTWNDDDADRSRMRELKKLEIRMKRSKVAYFSILFLVLFHSVLLTLNVCAGYFPDSFVILIIQIPLEIVAGVVCYFSHVNLKAKIKRLQLNNPHPQHI